MDTYSTISHRLYRGSCNFSNGAHLKDLSKLGRDLKRIIIVDNKEENFELQPENGIRITSWYNDVRDTELKKLEPFLRSLVQNGVDDVREHLRTYNRKKGHMQRRQL